MTRTGIHNEGETMSEAITVMTLSMEGCGGFTVEEGEEGTVFAELKTAMDEGHDIEYTIRIHQTTRAVLDAAPEFEGF